MGFFQQGSETQSRHDTSIHWGAPSDNIETYTRSSTSIILNRRFTLMNLLQLETTKADTCLKRFILPALVISGHYRHIKGSKESKEGGVREFISM